MIYGMMILMVITTVLAMKCIYLSDLIKQQRSHTNAIRRELNAMRGSARW
jgi:hypothetical protein